MGCTYPTSVGIKIYRKQKYIGITNLKNIIPAVSWTHRRVILNLWVLVVVFRFMKKIVIWKISWHMFSVKKIVFQENVSLGSCIQVPSIECLLKVFLLVRVRIRVEWFQLFAIFENGHIDAILILSRFLWVQFQKIYKVFIFLKSQKH